MPAAYTGNADNARAGNGTANAVVQFVGLLAGFFVGGFVIAAQGVQGAPRQEQLAGVLAGAAGAPIFVMGLPKAGTTSLKVYFECGGLKTSHYFCDATGEPKRRLASTSAEASEATAHTLVDWTRGVPGSCADCIQHNVKAGLPALHGCNGYDAFAQLDLAKVDPHQIDCYYPQVDAISAIYSEYPDSTFVLNLRPAANWLRSVDNYRGLRGRLIKCDIGGFGRDVGKTDAEMLEWYHSHADNVREFARAHPSLKLVEVNIEEPDAGDVLERAFGIPSHCWGKENVNPLLHPWLHQ